MRVVAVAGSAVLMLAACTPTTSTPSAPGDSTDVRSTDARSTDARSTDALTTDALTGELTIFAAASLMASFTELGRQFGADHPGVTVKPISFDGSSTLATQLREGAPVDVFASADEATMGTVADLADGAPAVFATNILQIAVEPGNPLGIRGLDDLARPGVQVVLCAPAVPCGAASHALLGLERVTVTPVSEEQNVTAVLTKVRAGEADAGLVYLTDVAAASGAVDGVAIAGADRAGNSYPIAAMNGSRHPDVAHAFVEFVLSARGQAVVATYGFGAP